MVTQLPDGKVEFIFISTRAQRVTIAGDFNGWQPCFEMTRLDESRWRSRMKLAPGIYQFRYCADGQWHTDYAAFGLEHGPFGLNSVVKVDPARRRPPCRQTEMPVAESPSEPDLTPVPSEPDPISSLFAPLPELVLQ